MGGSVHESDGWVKECAYHVKERCIGEEGGSPKYAPVHGRFEICGCGSGDADDRLHGGIKVQKIRPANSQEVVMARRK
jgi:hypothetical protein